MSHKTLINLVSLCLLTQKHHIESYATKSGIWTLTVASQDYFRGVPTVLCRVDSICCHLFLYQAEKTVNMKRKLGRISFFFLYFGILQLDSCSG